MHRRATGGYISDAATPLRGRCWGGCCTDIAPIAVIAHVQPPRPPPGALALLCNHPKARVLQRHRKVDIDGRIAASTQSLHVAAALPISASCPCTRTATSPAASYCLCACQRVTVTTCVAIDSGCTCRGACSGCGCGFGSHWRGDQRASDDRVRSSWVGLGEDLQGRQHTHAHSVKRLACPGREAQHSLTRSRTCFGV